MCFLYVTMINFLLRGASSQLVLVEVYAQRSRTLFNNTGHKNIKLSRSLHKKKNNFINLLTYNIRCKPSSSRVEQKDGKLSNNEPNNGGKKYAFHNSVMNSFVKH